MVRGVARAVWSLSLSAFFLVPLSSVWTRPDVVWGQKVVFAAVALAAVARPAVGLALLAVLLPSALGVTSFLGGLPSTTVAECLVLAFVSGAAVHLAGPHPVRRDQLAWPAVVLAAAALTSAVTDLAAIRAVAPARPFFADLWSHLTITYWTEDAGNWIVVHDAIRWCAVLALGVFVERIVQPNATVRRTLVWTWIAGAAAACTFTVMRAVDVVARRETPLIESVLWLVTRVRLSVLNPDPNASGSILGFLLIAAVVIALRRRLWWMLALAVPLLAVAFGLAQSRAAIGAAIVVIAARFLLERAVRVGRLLPAVLLVVAVGGAAGTWMVFSRSHASPVAALGLRAEMAVVGVQMAARFPVFGVGLSDYARTSRRFIPPETALAAFAPNGENAHNNFLQVIVELGIPAGLAFIWLVVSPVVALWRGTPPIETPEQEGLTLGLSAFLVSAVFGHPLLIPEVAAMFFLGLGLTASFHDGAKGRRERARAVVWSAVAFYLISLSWRIRF